MRCSLARPWSCSGCAGASAACFACGDCTDQRRRDDRQRTNCGCGALNSQAVNTRARQTSPVRRPPPAARCFPLSGASGCWNGPRLSPALAACLAAPPERSVTASARLGPHHDCADERPLLSSTPPPILPAQLAAVLLARLARLARPQTPTPARPPAPRRYHHRRATPTSSDNCTPACPRARVVYGPPALRSPRSPRSPLPPTPQDDYGPCWPARHRRLAAMDHPTADLTAGLTAGVQPRNERSSPASAVCYLNMDQAQEPSEHSAAPSTAARGDDEADITPRPETPTVLDGTADGSLAPPTEREPGYFSPQPLRLYASKLHSSAPPSTNPSPTASANASTTSVDRHSLPPPPLTYLEQPDHPDRPGVQRDYSGNSTASVATVRAHTVEPIQTNFGPPLRSQADGPYYPNQSYAALQFQQYPPPYTSNALRTRSSHLSSLSAAQVPTLAYDHHRDMMESGSRTVGNSPTTSAGLFSPTTPPLHQQHFDEHGSYPSPYLHHTQRQIPKETHVADVDVDPVSGRKIINQYEVIDELGRGVHGKVKLGRNLETGVFVAIKIVDRYSKRRRLGKNNSHEDKIKREIAILKKARHPNIVSLLEVIDDPTRKKVYIVLEHVELGEVKWRTEGAREVCLVEYRRFCRESQGNFDDQSAREQDDKIIALAHKRLARQARRRARESHLRRLNGTSNEAWSFEHGGDSDEDLSDGRESQTSSAHNFERRPSTRIERPRDVNYHEKTMETAYRSTTPTALPAPLEKKPSSTGLEGTMYGAYDTDDLIRGRAPSLAGSSSSRFSDLEDEIPEHFRHVPLMTIQGARETFKDTVLGLEYLHYQGVIHRDIKPANLLSTKEHRIKISDFGVSYLGRGTSSENSGDQSESDVPDTDEAIELAKTVGTPAFYAPELCRTDPDAETLPVTGKIDVWALGVTLYCLVYGRVPFHDNNTFVLMRLITDQEPYLPKYRLKAVAERSGSRPSSHGRLYHAAPSTKRSEHDLEYEEVDDDLINLLRKLLIKDPRHRISIKEIKRHRWLLSGIDNSSHWVEETDPGRSFQGRRIEVSKDDVEKAVVPITLIDRVRSGVRKTLDTVLRMGQRGGSRRRAQSTTTGQDPSQNISAHSSSSTISQEGRRPSLALVNQSIFEALSRSRESEHPLSQSVTASPEARERSRFFDSPNSRTGSPALSTESSEHLGPLTGPSRPYSTDRAHSTMSSAASVRTIRQSDVSESGQPLSPIIPPALPGTPTALHTPGGSNLGGIFGGYTSQFIKNVRSRERMLKPPGAHMRAKSIDRLVGSEDDAHTAPSIALSTTFAAGTVDQPDMLRDFSPTAARGPSPMPHDLYSSEPRERAPSRTASISSAGSHYNRNYPPIDEHEVGEPNTYFVPQLQRESSTDRFTRAKQDLIRRRVMEERRKERPHSGTFQRPGSSLSQTACPPSPDDETAFQHAKVHDFLNKQHPGQGTSSETSPTGYQYPTQSKDITPSSSEDQLTYMSQSTSNPSIPSVVSANSSLAPDDCYVISSGDLLPALSSDSINQFDTPTDDPQGYDGDNPLESGEDEDSDEELLIMAPKKRHTHHGRAGSISNAELSRSNIREQIIPSRRRSVRSGSNGTVKKVQPQAGPENQGQK
ncbi:kinase-like protein [Amniculicola lignicola CBS 123094]|uniref:non-specific serine/threonine protein kinase n=1 Tax=Amniculicola lignicola CBS 123094 TaxID=1392246 RepID=A0A6A5WXB5_9PLEO|nr:kinase-like protein [Amniculicola lignicola CBS 123094]